MREIEGGELLDGEEKEEKVEEKVRRKRREERKVEREVEIIKKKGTGGTNKRKEW